MHRLLERGAPGKAPVRTEGQRRCRVTICGRANEVASRWSRLCGTDSRNAFYGSADSIFIIGGAVSPISQLFTPEFPLCTHRGCREVRGGGREGAAGRALSKPAERGRPKQVLRFPAPARLRGRGGQARPDAENYISHNPVHRRHLGRWAVAA